MIGYKVCFPIAALSVGILLATVSSGSETSPPSLQPIDERLLGVWREFGDKVEAEMIEFEPTRAAWVMGDKLDHIERIIGQMGDELIVSFGGNRHRLHFKLAGNRLTISDNRPGSSGSSIYERRASRPEAFDLQPLSLGGGKRPLAPERVAAIQTELSQRRNRDQEVREGGLGSQPSEEDGKRMADVDTDNTAYLIELVADIGWIDSARFSPSAASAAFLIVQHSGHLPLMLAALPQIEKDIEATGQGDAYALLYDRIQLSLARKQRYGSQIGFGPEGMFVGPLEDPEHVDERREKLGMQPLAEYLEFFQERNDGRPVQIREDF